MVGKAKVEAPRTTAATVVIEAPVARHGDVTIGRLEGRLTPRQGLGLRLLFDGLVSRGATIKIGGTPDKVATQADAVRWLLDQVADQVGIE